MGMGAGLPREPAGLDPALLGKALPERRVGGKLEHRGESVEMFGPEVAVTLGDPPLQGLAAFGERMIGRGVHR